MFHLKENWCAHVRLCAAQILSRAPVMEDFRMASSRVGAEGGIALAQGLSAGGSPSCNGHRCASPILPMQLIFFSNNCFFLEMMIRGPPL